MKKLIIYGIISEILYLFFIGIKILQNHFNDINAFGKIETNQNTIIHCSFVVLLTCLFIIYFLLSKKIINSKQSFKIILLFALLFSFTQFFIKPLDSYDINVYINQSRKFSHFKKNPYLQNIDIFKNDDWKNASLDQWSIKSSVYGPAFIYFGSIINTISCKNFTTAFYLYKISFLIIHLLLIILIYKSFGTKGAFLYSWNPLINFQIINNAHNDILIVFFLVLSLIFINNKTKLINLFGSLAALILSFLIKYTTIYFLPLYLIFLFQKTKEKIKFTFIVLIVFILSYIIFILPFGFWNIFVATKSYIGLPKIFASPCITIMVAIFFLFNLTNNLISAFLSARYFCLFIFFITYLFLAKKLICKKISFNKFISVLLWVNILFYALSANWLMPWYFVQPMILSIIAFSISNNNKYLLITHIFTFIGIFYYIFLR